MSDINEIIKRLDRIESKTSLTQYAFDKIIGPALGRIDRWRWKTDNQVDPRIEKKLDQALAKLDDLDKRVDKLEA